MTSSSARSLNGYPVIGRVILLKAVRFHADYSCDEFLVSVPVFVRVGRNLTTA